MYKLFNKTQVHPSIEQYVNVSQHVWGMWSLQESMVHMFFQQFFLYTVFTDLNRTNSTQTSHVVLCVLVFFWTWCSVGGIPSIGRPGKKDWMFSPSPNLLDYLILKKGHWPEPSCVLLYVQHTQLIDKCWKTEVDYPNTFQHQYLLDHSKWAYCGQV